MLGNSGNDGCGGFCFVLFFYFLIWVFGSGRILVGNGGSGGHGGGVVVIGLFDIFLLMSLLGLCLGFFFQFRFLVLMGFWWAVGSGQWWEWW